MFKDLEANKQMNYFEVRKNENSGLALIEIAISPFILSIFLGGIIFLFNLSFPIVPHWLLTLSVNLLKVSLIFPVLYFLIIVFDFLGERRIPRKVIKNKQINSNKVVSDKFKESHSNSVIKSNFKELIDSLFLVINWLSRNLIMLTISYIFLLFVWGIIWFLVLIFLGILENFLSVELYNENSFEGVTGTGGLIALIPSIWIYYRYFLKAIYSFSGFKGSLNRFRLLYGSGYLLFMLFSFSLINPS